MSVNIHASCVQLARAGEAFGAPEDTGILILGESGAGKSDLALRLIAQGAKLVADDRVEIFLENGQLIARAPESIAGLIEIRNVGIASLPYTDEARVALAVLLGSDENLPRLPEREQYAPPAELGLAPFAHPPLIRINAFEPSAPAKIAAAAAAHAHALFRENIKPK